MPIFSSAQNKIMFVAPPVIMSPSITVTMSPDITICNGQPATITATASCTCGPPFTYTWSPAVSLNNPNISNPVANPTTTTTYSCYVTGGPSANNNNNNIVTVTVNACLGVPQINEETGFTIYPNPSNGNFILNCAVSKGELEIYNVMGAKIYSTLITNQSTYINIDSPNGIYFLQLKTEQGTANKKLIINK